MKLNTAIGNVFVLSPAKMIENIKLFHEKMNDSSEDVMTPGPESGMMIRRNT
ncbi:hypothetical protein D3C72_2594730 [compost metagenome]